MAIRPPVVLVLAFGMIFSGAQGQELRVSAGRADSDHELLGSPVLLGASVEAPADSWLAVRLGIQYGRDDFQSTGTTCVGLVPPTVECGPELREEEARVMAYILGLVLTGSFGWGELKLVPNLRRIRFANLQTGIETGQSRRAEKIAYGPGVALELQVHLSQSPAIDVFTTAGFASHPWYPEEFLVDGYSPFESGAQLRWLEIGLSADLKHLRR